MFLYGGRVRSLHSAFKFFPPVGLRVFLLTFCIKGREGEECAWFSFGWIWGFVFGQIVSLLSCALPTNKQCPTMPKCKWPFLEHITQMRSHQNPPADPDVLNFYETVFCKKAAWLMYFFLELVLKYCRCRTWAMFADYLQNRDKILRMDDGVICLIVCQRGTGKLVASTHLPLWGPHFWLLQLEVKTPANYKFVDDPHKQSNVIEYLAPSTLPLSHSPRNDQDMMTTLLWQEWVSIYKHLLQQCSSLCWPLPKGFTSKFNYLLFFQPHSQNCKTAQRLPRDCPHSNFNLQVHVVSTYGVFVPLKFKSSKCHGFEKSLWKYSKVSYFNCQFVLPKLL